MLGKFKIIQLQRLNKWRDLFQLIPFYRGINRPQLHQRQILSINGGSEHNWAWTQCQEASAKSCINLVDNKWWIDTWQQALAVTGKKLICMWGERAFEAAGVPGRLGIGGGIRIGDGAWKRYTIDSVQMLELRRRNDQDLVWLFFRQFVFTPFLWFYSYFMKHCVVINYRKTQTATPEKITIPQDPVPCNLLWTGPGPG